MYPSFPMFAALALGACGPADDTVHAGRRGPGVDTAERSDMVTRDITIATDRGQLTARLADNGTARAFAALLPLTIRMHDHLRQEKTGMLPTTLPDTERQTQFSTGTLGLWSGRDFVIYYKGGRVPPPGIVVLGNVRGDLSMLDNADDITVTVRSSDEAKASPPPA